MELWHCSKCGYPNSYKRNTCFACGTEEISDEECDLLESLGEKITSLRQQVEELKASQSQKWDYLQVTSEQLNEVGGLSYFGRKGWELVSVGTYSVGGGFMIDGIGAANYTVKALYVFKRPSYPIPEGIIKEFINIQSEIPDLYRFIFPLDPIDNLVTVDCEKLEKAIYLDE